MTNDFRSLRSKDSVVLYRFEKRKTDDKAAYTQKKEGSSMVQCGPTKNHHLLSLSIILELFYVYMLTSFSLAVVLLLYGIFNLALNPCQLEPFHFWRLLS